MNLLNTLIQFGLLLSVIWANPIQDIIQKYDDGSPMIIYFYEEDVNILKLKEKRFIIKMDKLKPLGNILGFNLVVGIITMKAGSTLMKQV